MELTAVRAELEWSGVICLGGLASVGIGKRTAMVEDRPSGVGLTS